MRLLFPRRNQDALTPDLCVIGAGAAGCAAALTGAALGAATMVVEAAEPGGLRVSHDAPFAAWREAARRAAEGGARPAWETIAVQAARAARAAAVSSSFARLRAAGVSTLSGHARFVGPDRLLVGGVEVAARRFVVATGAAAKRPAAPGLDLVRALDVGEAMALTRRPERAAILGAGGTGLALAQIFARLGAGCVVVDSGAALADLPAEFAEPILRRLAAEGVEIAAHARVDAIEPAGEGALVTLAGGRTIEATHLVVATGWRAATEGLGLETTGARADAGRLRTRPDLRTTARRIYAAGAAAGAGGDAEIAARTGRLAARSALLGLGGDTRLAAAPTFWPLDPLVVRLGLDEEAARAQRIDGVRVLRASLGEDAEAQASGRRDGHMALTVDKRGRLLGATLSGRDVGAAAATLSMAVAQRLDVGALADAPLPGLGGLAALNRALGVEMARRARAPAVAWLMRWRRPWR